MQLNNNIEAKGVIVYLAPPGILPHRSLTIGQDTTRGDLDNFIRSLSLLKKHFLDLFPRPVIVFYEHGFSEEMQLELVEKSGVSPTFILIEFSLPSFLTEMNIPEMHEGKFPLGYRHMCRFFSGMIFQQKTLEKYDWMWRLDTDSFITSPVDRDLFTWMESKGYDYGYNYLAFDDERYVHGLWMAHLKYIRQRNIRPTFLHKFVGPAGWNMGCFYTNFEISRLAFWRSACYQEYFDYLDRLGGIFTGRWGDAPIHTLALATFLSEKKVVRLNQFGYEHYPLVIDTAGRCKAGFGEWFVLPRPRPWQKIFLTSALANPSAATQRQPKK